MAENILDEMCNKIYLTSSYYIISLILKTSFILCEVILSIENISKHYGRIKALEQLSLEISRGNIYGILGPNGSGKTTLLGIVLDVINPTAGTYKWFGETPNKDERKRIGAILETPNFYPYLSAVKNLQIIADIKGVSYNEIARVLETVDLTSRKHSTFRTFSLGMKQRLAIAAALMGNPDVLILDEPTNGLDPQGIAEIRNIILEIAKKGITIILASHLLDEVQKICTHVSVLKQGHKLYSGNVKEILNDSVLVEISGPHLDAIIKTLNDFEQVLSIEKEDDLLIVKLADNSTSSDLSNFLSARNISISHLALRKKSLEKYFLELLAESND